VGGMKEINETGEIQYYRPRKKLWIAFLLLDAALIALIVSMIKN
jgi:hypothetical protein